MERIVSGELELRAGGKVRGIALPWNVRSPTHRERFEPYSAQLAQGGISLNIAHDSERVIAFTGAGLIAENRDAGLYIEAELSQANPAAAKARELIEQGHRGLSVEFLPIRETRDSAGDRVIQAATVHAVGLVKHPSYPTAAELRRRRRGGRGRIAPAAIRACACVGPDCDKVDFEPDSFRAFADTLKTREADLVAHTGGFSPDKVLASLIAGTLAITVAGDGSLIADLSPEAFDTPAGRDLAESLDATEPVIRPLIDDSLSEFEDVDGVRIYTLPWITSLLLKVAQNPEGWEALELIETGQRRDRRALLWL